MSRDDIKNKREPLITTCIFCGNIEMIAVQSDKTKACICFKCFGGSLTQMGLQIQRDGEVGNEPR